ncbi:hypothetical protein HD806DRAFT_551235 [Xylariaceae sp. AK1471]|nr:hypothetical protein HD806DRAFT_551235 [Xylariaceae sp. AK1471]
MVFQTTVFDLTPSERHSILSDIKHLLLRTASLLARAQQHSSSSSSSSPSSLHDYAEALSLINSALALATDPDACDSSLAPLATCNLYKGHVLLGLKRYAEAYDAYTLAATAHTRALVDAPVARDAARGMLELRGRMAGEKRMGCVYEPPRKSLGSFRHGRGRADGEGGGRGDKMGKLGLAFLLADMPLPVTLRPGPVKRKPVVIVRKGREEVRVDVVGEGAEGMGMEMGRSKRFFTMRSSTR